jgi:predicted DCC family thiol-disulfide oxidoreductase YuxK
MKIVRLVTAFLLAPLMAFPVAFVAAVLLKTPEIASLASGFDSILHEGADTALLALGIAYVLMLVLGIPVILGLGWRETFSRRSLEIACALIGGVPAYFCIVYCRDLEGFLIAVVWLAAGGVSGALAGRMVWSVLTEPFLPGSRPQRGSGLGGARPTEAILTVLYDGQCAFCRRAQTWLEGQPKYVSMTFVAAGSEEARRRFPGLDPGSALSELTVVGWRGEVYREAKAWIMCLWALKRYRSVALRFSTPERMPMARRFVAWISRNRFRIAEAAGWTR